MVCGSGRPAKVSQPFLPANLRPAGWSEAPRPGRWFSWRRRGLERARPVAARAWVAGAEAHRHRLDGELASQRASVLQVADHLQGDAPLWLGQRGG
jgi:hypothetical protein